MLCTEESVPEMALILHIEKQTGPFFLKVNLEMEDGILALLGESGCGSSLVLRCIAGIEKPDRGRIIVDDTVFYDSEKHIDLPPQKRLAGMMFRNYALFPSMSVYDNIYAGANREHDRQRRVRMVNEMLERFGLTDVKDLKPSLLSADLQMRTALARLLLSSSRILLLEDPFSAVEQNCRFRLEREFRSSLADFGKTVVFSTYDHEEVSRFADHLAVMRDGNVAAFGRKAQIFADPKTCYTASLTGCDNISPIRIMGPKRVLALDWNVELDTDVPVGNGAFVGIRRRDVVSGVGLNSCFCDVLDAVENTSSYTLILRPAERESAGLIFWETDKKTWQQLRSRQISVRLPSESLLLLNS